MRGNGLALDSGAAGESWESLSGCSQSAYSAELANLWAMIIALRPRRTLFAGIAGLVSPV